jgi:hypothetical protein
MFVQDLNAATARAAYHFLESSLRHKSEVVVYEAARAICHLPGVEMNDLSPAITVLQLFLSRFVSLSADKGCRTCARLAQLQAGLVSFALARM